MKKTIAIIWTIIWLIIGYFWFYPTLSFTARPWVYFYFIFYFGTLYALFKLLEEKNANSKNSAVLHKLFGGITIALSIMLIIGSIYSLSIFHASRYRNLIGEVKDTTFTAHVKPVATEQMLLVDSEIAKRIGEKTIGNVPGLGSRVMLDDFHLQLVKGKLFWIAPLLHSGFFKWWSFADEGTPGFVYVSATDPENYGLMQNMNDRYKTRIKIKYQPEASFNQNLDRHIYLSGYASKLYRDPILEVDENWKPFWTVTLYDTKIGFEGHDANGVLTVDVQTGEIKEYSIKNAPAWIDRIQPPSFVKNQLDDWGNLVHGWWNPSGLDKMAASSDYSIVLGDDSKSYFYYGITSQGKEESTVGFAMVNTRTKEVHWFKQAGATEAAAKKSAMGKYPEKGYTASEGITYNIDGHATYEFLMKDGAKLMKMVAFVNVHDHNILGVGETRAEALQDYRANLNGKGNNLSINEVEMDKITVIAKVKRFGEMNIRGNTFYYLTLDKGDRIKLTAGTTLSTDLPLTKEGDIVQVSYIKGTAREIPMISFINKSLDIIDPIDVQAKSELDSVRNKKIEIKNEEVIDQKWKKLPASEKRKKLDKK